MNMTNMLLEGRFFKNQEASAKMSWLFLVIGTLLILITMYFRNAIIDVLALFAISTTLFYLDTYKFIPEGYEISLSFVLFSIFSCYSWNTLISFYFASQDKKFLKSAFGSYISPELIDQMYEKRRGTKTWWRFWY